MEAGIMSDKLTLIVGATTNPTRYAYFAASRLADAGVPFIPIGIKTGELFGEKIMDLRAKPALENIHTITLYIGPSNQEEWIDYLISLAPERIIFNPGTENPVFFQKAKANGIEVLQACTLVMLSTNQY
ncbi:putative CoA-binding protein [Algoriphagus sp. 4150]|uniref:CoA-binding protein n=1 Tax=Algoriphagus sp. 4150 TaxID=2817756 RepID=UPI0028614817|nr:CoA-binding protein [Algoriphagus sp. 4150]MDR7130734.1 putative CoA-binding protein [Algoriphagus sp. 4150]